MGQNLRKLHIIKKQTSDELHLNQDQLVRFELSVAGEIGRTFGAICDLSNKHLIMAGATVGTSEPQINNALLLYDDYDYEIVNLAVPDSHPAKNTKYLIITKKK